MRRSDLLRFWEDRYGVLAPGQRKKFLKRNELTRICAYHEDAVREALREHQKLKNVSAYLETWYWREDAERASAASPVDADPGGWLTVSLSG